MKKPLAVIGVLCAFVVGLAIYNRTDETKITQQTSTSEISDAVPASAGPVAEPSPTTETQTTFRAEGTIGVSVE